MTLIIVLWALALVPVMCAILQILWGQRVNQPNTGSRALRSAREINHLVIDARRRMVAATFDALRAERKTSGRCPGHR